MLTGAIHHATDREIILSAFPNASCDNKGNGWRVHDGIFCHLTPLRPTEDDAWRYACQHLPWYARFQEGIAKQFVQKYFPKADHEGYSRQVRIVSNGAMPITLSDWCSSSSAAWIAAMLGINAAFPPALRQTPLHPAPATR